MIRTITALSRKEAFRTYCQTLPCTTDVSNKLPSHFRETLQNSAYWENAFPIINPHQHHCFGLPTNEDSAKNSKLLFSRKQDDELFEEDRAQRANDAEKEDLAEMKDDEEEDKDEEKNENKNDDDDDDDNFGGGLMIPVVQWVAGLIPRLAPKGAVRSFNGIKIPEFVEETKDVWPL